MTGTEEITLKDINNALNQVLDRLSEIEMILNDPMHGLDLPEGLTMQAGTVMDLDTVITTQFEMNEGESTFTLTGDKND